MSAKERRKQQIIFLLVVLAIIFISVGSGLYFSGMRLGNFGESYAGKGAAGKRYTNMADAQVICEERARKVFGPRILNLMVDTHSTRFDKKAGLFRVFMESELYANDSRQGATVRHFISCTARSDRVAIASFQFAKDGEPMQEQGGSVFGL